MNDRVTAREGWDDTTLWQRFAALAGDDPHAPAVIDQAGERTVSRGRLLADANALAADLEAGGARAGAVISVQLPNRYEAAAVALAALRLGLVINILLPGYRANELEHIFSRARPRIVVTPDVYRDHDHVEMIDGLRTHLPADVRHMVFDEAGGQIEAIAASARRGAVPGAALPAADRLSEIIFSSGTESTPKGVMHSEQTTNAGVRALHQFLALGADDVVWMPSPVGHSTGFNFGLRFALYHGLPLVLQDRWDAAVAMDLVGRFRASYTLAATTFLQDLIDELDRRGRRLQSLSRFACGGAAVPPDVVQAAARHGIGVLRLYGSTEALVITCNPPGAAEHQRLHTDGTPLPGVTLRTRADDGRLCGPGEPGEIEIRSWQNGLGYFEDPERTAATFLPGNWVRSGDLGVLGEDGALTIVGRKKEIIIRGGLNITPREIEELVLEFDEVERCAVIGLPDARLGETVCACVTLRAGRTLGFEQMAERLRAAGLATYKLPQRLEVLASLPATASGKIRKHVLQRQLSA